MRGACNFRNRHETDVMAVPAYLLPISESDQETASASSRVRRPHFFSGAAAAAPLQSGPSTGQRPVRLRPACRQLRGSGSAAAAAGCFGGGLNFFRIARRRHYRDQGNVAGGDDTHAFRQGDVASGAWKVDLKLADVDVMPVGMASARQRTSMVWVTMLTVPPRFTPGDCSAFLTWIGNIDADGGALAEPHEIHMQRQVAHRVELEVAGNNAMLHAVDSTS